jgi:hypothetical protein
MSLPRSAYTPCAATCCTLGALPGVCWTDLCSVLQDVEHVKHKPSQRVPAIHTRASKPIPLWYDSCCTCGTSTASGTLVSRRLWILFILFCSRSLSSHYPHRLSCTCPIRLYRQGVMQGLRQQVHRLPPAVCHRHQRLHTSNSQHNPTASLYAALLARAND